MTLGRSSSAGNTNGSISTLKAVHLRTGLGMPSYSMYFTAVSHNAPQNVQCDRFWYSTLDLNLVPSLFCWSSGDLNSAIEPFTTSRPSIGTWQRLGPSLSGCQTWHKSTNNLNVCRDLIHRGNT